MTTVAEPILIVHGGAGTFSGDPTIVTKALQGVKEAAREGYKTLQSTGSVLDSVEKAVQIMEDNEIFNAGKGSVLNLDGEVEMDACIMQGSDLNSGAVTIVKNVKNPITLARLVMEKTDHVLLGAEGAVKFGLKHNITIVSQKDLITDKSLDALSKWKAKHHCVSERGDTVGAVAIDKEGKLAAATSTGGREGKLMGRSSDTCMIGSGTYADDTVGAVSTTGHGETIAKFCLAHAIINSIERGHTAQEATSECIARMTKRLDNTAGAITLSRNGDIGIGFSTNRMAWAYRKGEELHFGIEQKQHEVEKLEC